LIAALSLVLAGVAGCSGPTRIPPPSSPAPTLRGPEDAIPGDLDVAIRIDLGRIRSVLGSDAFERLRQTTLGRGEGGDAATHRLMTEALSRADAVWIAFRPGSRPELTDSVTVLKGEFKGLDPHALGGEPAWQMPLDLGADWRRWDRPKPKLRSAPARIYARGDELLVFVSEAPLDSVERRLELGADDAHVEPTEKGLLSVDARAASLRELVLDRSPTLGRVLAHAERVRLNADLESLGLRAELSLQMESETAARETAEALGELAAAIQSGEGLAARVVSGLRIEAVGSEVVARLNLPPEVLAAVLGCVGGGSCD
jgi:hypothetical protein